MRECAGPTSPDSGKSNNSILAAGSCLAQTPEVISWGTCRHPAELPLCVNVPSFGTRAEGCLSSARWVERIVWRATSIRPERSSEQAESVDRRAAPAQHSSGRRTPPWACCSSPRGAGPRRTRSVMCERMAAGSLSARIPVASPSCGWYETPKYAGVHGLEFQVLQMRTRLLIPLLVLTASFSTASVSHADVVTKWNSAALAAIRANKTPPPRASRALAILHASIYDAISGITRSHRKLFRAERCAGQRLYRSGGKRRRTCGPRRFVPCAGAGFRRPSRDGDRRDPGRPAKAEGNGMG